MAVTQGAVWVANGLDATVSRIDSQTNQVSQVIAVGNGPTGATAGEGAVWVTNSTDGTVTRIDPASGRVTRTFPAVLGASGIAAGFGRLWIVSPPSAKVVALDPASGRVVNEIGIGVDPAAIAVGADAVWVTNRADGTVSKIEPRTGAVIGTTAVGRGPTGIVAGPDAVWVANAGDGTLSEVDPATVKVVKSVPLGNPPRDVVRVPHGVYVTVGSNGSEHRGGNLQVASVLEPDFIDPALAYTQMTWSMLTMTNDGLVAFRKVGGVQGIQLVPDLAISLPILTEGGKAYTFQLRPGIRYSNGMLVQPADFRRAIERVLELGSPGALFYTGIVGADRCRKGKRCDLSRGIVTDREARTVTFKLTAADGDFLSKLALPFALAVPASTPSHPVGTVPSRPQGLTGSPRTGRRPRCSASFATHGSASGRPTLSREASPTRSPSRGPYGLSDPSSRVRAVKRGHADVTRVGTGPPAGEGGGRPARGPVPGPASLQYGLQHRVLLPQHPHPAVR